jgi:hypothetical protein
MKQLIVDSEGIKLAKNPHPMTTNYRTILRFVEGD